MKNKILALILAGLFLPAFVFGAVSYERNPSGYTIENPVSFNVSFDEFSDILCDPDANYWIIKTTNEEEILFTDDCLASTTLNYVFSGTLPLGEYMWVQIMCADTFENCEAGILGGGEELEGDSGEAIFEVVEGGEYNILPSINITGILAYAGRIFTDLEGIIILLIGIPVGFFVVKKAIGIVKKRVR